MKAEDYDTEFDNLMDRMAADPDVETEVYADVLEDFAYRIGVAVRAARADLARL